MKKIVFTLAGLSLFTFFSFMNKSSVNTASEELLFSEALIGNWTYQSVTRNGNTVFSDSCDMLDFIKLSPSKNFEALQHINVISSVTGIGTFTNCNPIETRGRWSVTPDGILTCNDKTMQVFEITKTTLKLKSVISHTNANGKIIKDIYIDSYIRQ